jgi:hypothetical protein
MPRFLTRLLLTCWVAALAISSTVVRAQGELLPTQPAPELGGEGWSGFTNLSFLGHALLDLVLATVLGAAIAFHPRSVKRVDSVEEAEAPKVYITYAVVGAVIGLMVVEYGLVVGFVVFGIGGLFRFRTALPSVANTGRLILVTLVGLACGLRLPHLGVLATAFGFALIFWMDRKITYQMEVKDLEPKHVARASEVYRAIIERQGGKVIRETRSFTKSRVAFIFRAPHRFSREDFDQLCEEHVPETLKGVLDWEIE